jgi:hypothetical protein
MPAILWLTIALVSAGLRVGDQDSYDLRFAPKSGFTWSQKVELGVEQRNQKTEVEAVLEHKVMKVGKDGETVIRTVSKGAIMRTPSGEIADNRPNERTAKYSADGTLVSIESGMKDVSSYRQAFVTRYFAPPAKVKIGDKWRYERKADSPKGVPGLSVSYVFAEVEGQNGKITFQLEEKGVSTPQKAAGTWWVRLSDGMPIRLDELVTDYLGEAGTKAKVKVQLVLPKS